MAFQGLCHLRSDLRLPGKYWAKLRQVQNALGIQYNPNNKAISLNLWPKARCILPHKSGNVTADNKLSRNPPHRSCARKLEIYSDHCRLPPPYSSTPASSYQCHAVLVTCNLFSSNSRLKGALWNPQLFSLNFNSRLGMRLDNS